MRIVLLSTGHPEYDLFPDGGGIQNQILGLAVEMAGRGHEVHIICRSVNHSQPGSNGVIFHALHGNLRSKILSLLAFSRKANTVIGSLEPDVVSAFERFSAYFPSFGRVPMTFTTENYDAFRYYRRFSIEYNPLNTFVFPWKRRLEEGVMRRARMVVALTPSIQEYLRSVEIDHVTVIPNGVRSHDYRDLGDEGYILYAGRLDAPKRVDLLIQAFALLGDRFKDHRLQIVGKGPERSRLVKLARECGVASRIEFKEWVSRERLRRILGSCTAFVLPSIFEALPIVMLEAMACSKTVIAMNVSGPRDVLTDGDNGLLVETRSAQELAEKIGTCLESASLRESIGTRARQTVEDSYDFSRLASRMLELYERTAAS